MRISQTKQGATRVELIDDVQQQQRPQTHDLEESSCLLAAASPHHRMSHHAKAQGYSFPEPLIQSCDAIVQQFISELYEQGESISDLCEVSDQVAIN